MQDISNQELVIFSTFVSCLDMSEQLRRENLMSAMLTENRIDFIYSVGSYKGVKENSFVAFIKNEAEKEFIERLCFDKFSQESILYQHSNGKGYLLYSETDNIEYIGTHYTINRKQAKKAEGYTKIPRYYFTYQF